MPTAVIAGNWKMNLNAEQAVALARGIRSGMPAGATVEVGVAPPAPYLAMVAEVLDGSPVWVAGQDLHEETHGAFTGEVAGSMLRDVGATHVIVGHSERRHVFGESHERVGAKLRRALEVELHPILCVGETREEREAGRMREVLLAQTSVALQGLAAEDLGGLILAYKPVWAIGTGLNATSAQAGESHALLRDWFQDHFTASFAEQLRIQYGGSVKPDNAAELLSTPGVNGALVGGAALKTDSFLNIVSAVPASSPSTGA